MVAENRKLGKATIYFMQNMEATSEIGADVIYWKYRVIRTDGRLQIREVYHTEEGVPGSMILGGLFVEAETKDGLRRVLDEMRKATEKPPLIWDGASKRFLEYRTPCPDT
jgi:hypothetical protein